MHLGGKEALNCFVLFFDWFVNYVYGTKIFLNLPVILYSCNVKAIKFLHNAAGNFSYYVLLLGIVVGNISKLFLKLINS